MCCAGGYYLSMAADVIVAQPLTITGSIGVVLAKFNLEELYRRVGYTKTPISRGQCVASRFAYGPDILTLLCQTRVHRIFCRPKH